MNLRLLVSIFLTIPFLVGADWPRFHGLNGNGTANGPDLPLEFSNQKNLVWKASLSGEGNGSPIVVQGMVIVPSDCDNGTKRKLSCFDVSNGKLKWEYEQEGRKVRIHRKNSMASSTPAADGERIVATFWDGTNVHLVALSHAGQLLWQKNLGRFVSEHGAGISPIIHDNKVYLVFDHDEDSDVMCFDAKSGSKDWTGKRQHFNACYSTPFIFNHDGRIELVVTTTAGVTAYDPKNGDVLWDHKWDWSYTKDGLRTVGSSFAAHGLIFAHAGNGGGNSHALVIHPPKTGEREPTLAWEKKKAFPYVPSMLVHQSHLFTVTDRGVAGCYDSKTGKEIWVERLGGGFTASPVLHSDRIFAFSEDGIGYVYRAGSKFELLARNELGEPVMASPAIADGRLFVRGKNTLYCFGLPTTKAN